MPKKKAKDESAQASVPNLHEVILGSKVRRQLHQSALTMLEDCGMRFYYRYVLGEKTKPNAFVAVGSATHAIVRRDLDSKIDTGELLPDEAIEDLASDAFTKAWESEEIVLEEDERASGLTIKEVRKRSKDKTLTLTTLHHAECAPTLRPVATEQQFCLDLDPFLRQRAKKLHAMAEDSQSSYDRKMLHAMAAACNAIAREGLDLAGTLDVREQYVSSTDQRSLYQPEETIITIRDTKTSGKSPTASIADQIRAGKPIAEVKAGMADDSLQLTLYALATQVTEGRLPDFVALDYLVQTQKKDGSLGSTYYVPTYSVRTAEDVEVELNRVVNAAHVLHTGVFTPANPTWWGCSKKWCGYWERCEYAKKPKLVQIGDVR